MDAERIIEEIKSDTLVLHNLSKYKGKRVEVLIFPLPESEDNKITLAELPRRRYGKIQNSLSRNDIYEDER